MAKGKGMSGCKDPKGKGMDYNPKGMGKGMGKGTKKKSK